MQNAEMLNAGINYQLSIINCQLIRNVLIGTEVRRRISCLPFNIK